MPQKPKAQPPTPPSFWATSERVPDIFSIKQQTTPTVMNTHETIQQQSYPVLLVFYKQNPNIIAIAQGQSPTGQATMHETGHAIWYNDLTPQQQQQWNQLHASELKRSTPASAISNYHFDPSHSF